MSQDEVVELVGANHASGKTVPGLRILGRVLGWNPAVLALFPTAAGWGVQQSEEAGQKLRDL